METNRPLFIPVILGTPRKGRLSEHAARFVVQEVGKRDGVETELIDIRDLPLRMDEGEDIKDPQFSATMMRADALILVAPEYNHGIPGLLKHVLDTNLKEYIHKAVGICGVSAGPFGGTRVVQNMLPIMRELGLVTIFWDCGLEMNHHAEKLDYTATLNEPDARDPDLGGVIEEFHTCPSCGKTATRRTG